MGVNTNAILFWGFAVDEDSPTHEQIEDEGEDDGPMPGTLARLSYMGDDDGGVTIGHHCSDGCTMYYVAIKASEQTAYRGHVVEAKMDQAPEWPDMLRAFCDKYAIEMPEPKWLLVSYWG